MKNSITANTEIGGTFINVEVTPIENGKRIDGYTKQVYVMTEIENIPKNRRRTNTLKHIINTVGGVLIMDGLSRTIEANFSINGINFLFENKNEKKEIRANYIDFSSRRTTITPISL